MEKTEVLNFEIVHRGRRIESILFNGHDIKDIVLPELKLLKIECDFQRPDNSNLVLSDSLKSTTNDVFDAICELQKENACLAAYFASFFFELFTPIWTSLLKDGRHILAIQLWRGIIKIVLDYEKITGKHIHKGSPYAFLADTYLIIGEIDTGFTYIYNAIEDDIKLNSVCPEMNYPQNAPVYLTASISSNPRNIMIPLVKEIRTELGNYISSYRNEFNKSLSLDEFDILFLQNPTFEIIKYYFVFTFWMIYEHKNKINNSLMKNDFSKLKNANWFFSLCLIIDKLLFSHKKYSADQFGTEIKNYILHTNLLNETDLKQIISGEKIYDCKPDKLIPKLLSLRLTVNGNVISKEIHYLFIAWNLRNFAGHNIEIQNVISDNFDPILKALLFDLFLIVEEFKVNT